MAHSGGVGARGVAARPAESAKSSRTGTATYGEGVRQRNIEREEKKEAKRRKGAPPEVSLEGAAPIVAEPVEVPRAAPPLTIDERREAVRRVRAHADEVVSILEGRGVPMPLLKQRLDDVRVWGDGLLDRFVEGRPTDEESLEIQAGLDAQKAAAEYVHEVRNRTDRGGVRTHPHFPYDSKEQALVAAALEGMHLSAQQTDALFALLHGGEGGASLLRQDLQADPRLLSRLALEEAADKMPRCVLYRPRPHLRMCCMRACSHARV